MNGEFNSNTSEHQTNHKKYAVIKEIVAAIFRTLFLSTLVAFIAILLISGNFLGFFNFGTDFSPFPATHDNTSFSDALKFMKEVPFNKIDKLEKWTSPITIRYEGNYKPKDIETLKKIVSSFNTIKGFPGIKFVDSNENVLVSFVSKVEFPKYKEKYQADSNYQSFCKYYSSDDVLYKGAIVIINEGLQGYQNSVVLHEFFHLVGFFDHTNIRSSILNKSGPVPTMSATDVLAFKMIYNPDIKPKTTYQGLLDYYSKADISSYISASKPSKPNNPNAGFIIPIAIMAFILLFTFLTSIKRTGFIIAASSLLASTIVCVIVFYYFYMQRTDIMNIVNGFINKF
jgi:hypothetical protein